MRVTFLGTGAAMPLPDRVQTGLLVEAAAGDDRPLLVDCGSGVLHRLAQTDPGYEAVSSVLLTHHHLDHVSDLLALLKARWLAGEEHLEVVGPRGTKALLDGLLDTHDYLDGRVDLRVREVHDGESFEVAGVAVEASETRHSMDCLAYRFAGTDDASGTADGGDGEFVFSGDSEAFAGLASFADGARVLAHDCSFPDDVDVDSHPTPSQLGDALAGRDIDRVYLTHLYPHTEGRHEEMVASVRERFDGDVRVARDGLRFGV
ncbi:MBL fold metallo-hydrolase [Candidatus Halobonum tyrrellensis]|uniref:Metal-dependent hydrolase n=1 Tax=Candidatus Halobonum tyrrellensis G22 TaxID=1324957 RepID=V4HNF9_9EURY|nr:MBL fold metallo-hydrolase [Candidatus Halobonum tyrrellensis]ESP89459.1 metal-dependent hydrolase [Candidatus Halobonum tyrrellensis G22]